MHVNDLLKIACENGASDLHLKVGSYPMMRLRGSLTPASEEKRLEHDDMVAMAAAAATRSSSAARSAWSSVSFRPAFPRSTNCRCRWSSRRLQKRNAASCS